MKKRRTQPSGKASFLPVLPAGDLERWLTERCQSDQNFKTRSPAGSQNLSSPQSMVGGLGSRKDAIVSSSSGHPSVDKGCRRHDMPVLRNHMTHADLGHLLSS